jgi:hypothetical protein
VQQSEKHWSPRLSTEAGIEIDGNAKQPEKTRASIRLNFDPRSNFNDERNLQWEKHLAHIISTDAGIQISRRYAQSEKASASIRFSFDTASNVNDEILRFREKHPAPILSIWLLNTNLLLDPTYRTTEVPVEFIRKFSNNWKFAFPSSTVIAEIAEHEKAEP